MNETGLTTTDRIEGLLDWGCKGLDNEEASNFEKDLKVISHEVHQLKAENKKLKESYNEIFEYYIPTRVMDEANRKLILLLEPKDQQAGMDLLKENKT